MNLENYLSATLPSSVVAKIFEENVDKEKHKNDDADGNIYFFYQNLFFLNESIIENTFN